MLHGFTVEELLTCVRAGLATATAKLSVEEVGSLKRCQVSVWPLTSMRSNRPNGRIVGGLEKVCPDGQRACLGCRHCLHTRGCLSVGGQRGAFGATNSVSAVRNWQGRVWSTALAVILWLIWLVLQLGSIHAPWPTSALGGPRGISEPRSAAPEPMPWAGFSLARHERVALVLAAVFSRT